MDNDSKLELALWRYGIISPLLHRQANDAHLCELLDVLSQNRFIRPDGKITTIQTETARKWLYRYNHGGLTALENKTRSDLGSHNVPKNICDAMWTLRQHHPRWTVALILDTLILHGLWDGTKPSRSLLYRFAKDNNLMRGPHLAGKGTFRAFAFDRFGQLWLADFMHGPKLHMNGKKRKSYLHVIIDDCTRYVVSGRFHAAENVESLIRDLMTATRRFGLAQRLYTDNGAAYSSRYLKVVAANLGMQLPHTPPYRPQGRSKVERFFRTVRERFLAKKRFATFDEINEDFVSFIEDYLNRRHSTLKCTPMQKRLCTDSVCRALPEVANIEALFRYHRRCRVYKDGTIRLKNRIFEVPECLPGSRVKVFFMPWDLSRVYYGDDMHPALQLDTLANAHRFDHPNFAKIKETKNDNT